MKYIEKYPSRIKRFLNIWKHEGFYSASKNSLAWVKNRLHLELNRKPAYRVSGIHYQDIYNSYISTGRNKLDSEYVTLPSYDLSKEDLPVKAIAFYLPQYHPVPENDAWWGKGFTEWTNVSKAVPNFVGHYQPHLPGELGFYDLRVPEVQQRQVELAKKFGLYGFCFYYYWFNGKKLLDLPLEQYVKNPEINFPFCLCWANENWTRTWDGLDKEVLIAQDHSAESDSSFIKDITPYLTNEKYIKVNGRPMLLVYRPQLLPNPMQTAKRWRGYCKEMGLEDLFLVAIQSGGIIDPRILGFDAAAEFPPHGIPVVPYLNSQLKITNPQFTGMVFDYKQVADQMSAKKTPSYRLFKAVITGWDNTPRRQDQAMIFHNSSPQIYQSWLSSVFKFTLENAPAGECLVFINAWNEWAEGTHLEPDRKYGYAYLDATAKALQTVKDTTLNHKVNKGYINSLGRRHNTAVILHLYYPDLWGETVSYLDHLNDNFDLFVSIPDDVDFDQDLLLQKYPDAYIYPCLNRGRDIAPFISLLSLINDLGYDYVCKIHTKKSVHREDGTIWRTEILDELLSTSVKIEEIKQKLNNNKVGIIGPKNHIISSQYFMGGNQELIDSLAAKLGLDYAGDYFTFIAGSMFWFKPSAIAPILNLNLGVGDFPQELGQIDGTLAHALERLIGLVASKYDYQILQTGTFSDTPNNDYNFAVPYREK